MATFNYTPAVSSQRIGDTLASLNTNFSGVLTQLHSTAAALNGSVVLTGLLVTPGTFPAVAIAAGTALDYNGNFQTMAAVATLTLPATGSAVAYVYIDNTGTIVNGTSLPGDAIPLGQLTNNSGGTAFTFVDLRPIFTTSLGTSQRSLHSLGPVTSLVQRQAGSVALEVRNAANIQNFSVKENGDVAFAGVLSGDGSGLINLPSLVSSHTYTVASQSAMLALTGDLGDLAVRTDTSLTYILAALPASTLGNWTQLLFPTAPVSSFNGRTGAVTLLSGDVTTALGYTPSNKAGDTFTGVTNFPQIGIYDAANVAAGETGNIQVVAGIHYRTSNCYFDGTNWQRVNTAKPYVAEGLDEGGHRLFYAGPSGANPIGTTLQSQDQMTSALAQDLATTTGLTYGYQPGNIRADTTIWAIAAGTLALTDNSTCRVEVDAQHGTVGFTTNSAFSTGHIPMAVVTTLSGAITSVLEQRAFLSDGGTGGQSTPVLIGTGDGSTTTFTLPGSALNENVFKGGVICRRNTPSTTDAAYNVVSGSVVFNIAPSFGELIEATCSISAISGTDAQTVKGLVPNQGVIPNTLVERSADGTLAGSLSDLLCTQGTGLVLNYNSGKVSVAGVTYAISGSAITLAASTTSYVFVDATGGVVVNTTGFPTTGPVFPMAQVVTGASSITGSPADKRAWATASGVSGLSVTTATTTPITAGSNQITLINLTTPANSTVNLPAQSSGIQVIIKDAAGNMSTYPAVVTPASGLIDGQTTATMQSNYMVLELVSDGTNWHII